VLFTAWLRMFRVVGFQFGQGVYPVPAHVFELAVTGTGLAACSPAPEGEIEVLREVAAVVGDDPGDRDRGECFWDGHNAGLLVALADSRVGWPLSGLDYPAGKCPGIGAGVAPENACPSSSTATVRAVAIHSRRCPT